MHEIEEAVGRVLPNRKAYAAQSGAWPLTSPCLPGDDERVYCKIECGLVSAVEKRADMLRFALTDAALLAMLPRLGEWESRADLADRLFSGKFPMKGEYEPLALAWARADILLRGKDAGRSENTPLMERVRDLLWLSVRAINENTLLAGKRCAKVLMRLTLLKEPETLGAIKYGHMALEKILTSALT